MSFASPQKRSSTQQSQPLPSHKKQKMSLTQTYFLAHTARAKLSKEASRGDHNLRRLVGHANLLDGLMIDLVEAERAQEALFNTAARQSHIQWAPEPSRTPTITEDYEEEDSDSDDEDIDEPIVYSTRRPAVTAASIEEDDEDDMASDDEEDYEHLALVRTPSRSSPPELSHELDDSSDDESGPSSPPSSPDMQMTLAPVSRSKKNTKDSISEAFYEDGFYLPPRQPVAVY